MRGLASRSTYRSSGDLPGADGNRLPGPHRQRAIVASGFRPRSDRQEFAHDLIPKSLQLFGTMR
jgi:hypothetical protein